MKLYIKDRVLIPSIFPESGSIFEIEVRKDILAKVALSEDLKSLVNFNQDLKTGECRWETRAADGTVLDDGVEVVFTGAELSYLKTCVDTLDAQKRVTEYSLDLCKAIKKE